MNSKPWTLTTLLHRRNKIDTNPDYQRPAVWAIKQKELLIDTILRGYDIPKIYLHKREDGKYDVIDGQQRIRAIWAFYDGEFALPKDSDKVNGFDIAGKYYNDLPENLQDLIDDYTLDVILLENVDEDEIREMFLRLQNGTSLKSQEKRNAYPGNMVNLVKNIAKHEFFVNSVNFKNSRFAHEHVAAQLCLLTLKGELCDIKDRNLNEMYRNNQNIPVDGDLTKKVKKVLNYLYRMFPEKSPELKRYNVISLYCLVSYLMENYAIKDRENEIAKWFTQFEQYRLEEMEKPEDEQNARLANYQSKTKDSTDGLDSLQYRDTFLKENLFATIIDLLPKDNNRNFDEIQRQVIFRRDEGKCKICGAKCEWNAWHADHIIPWNRGGKTTVENGQVLCISCNTKKSDKMT